MFAQEPPPDFDVPGLRPRQRCVPSVWSLPARFDPAEAGLDSVARSADEGEIEICGPSFVSLPPRWYRRRACPADRQIAGHRVAVERHRQYGAAGVPDQAEQRPEGSLVG